MRQCQELPGHELFQYVDDDGQRRTIASGDVNAYLRETAGEEFTAKDFRTWAGTVLAARALTGKLPGSETEAKRNVVEAIRAVAARLGNTAAIRRKCWASTRVSCRRLLWRNARLDRPAREPTATRDGLDADERAVLPPSGPARGETNEAPAGGHAGPRPRRPRPYARGPCV